MKANLLLSLILLISASSASAMMCDDNVSPFYLRAEGGASWSRKADICADPKYWPTAKEGYDNDLGNTAVVGFGFGLNVNEWLSLGVSSNYRGIFEYCQFQTNNTDQTINNLGDKTRFFDFDSTSYMFDIFFNRTGSEDSYGYEFLDCHRINPYIGAGVGFAANELWNFHTVRKTEFTPAGGTNAENLVNQIMTLKKDLQFAWQIAAGIDWSFHECANFAIGYRYFGSGDLPFNNYIVDNLPANEGQQTTAPAWNGKFRANELVVSFTLFF